MYFFDSYALVEIIKGNDNYEKYKNENPTCSILNLFELHQALLREFNKKTADFWINKFDYILIDFAKNEITEASDFRFAHKGKRLSMTDCIGYVLAKKNGLKFLTGDAEFKNKENVEFVEWLSQTANYLTAFFL